MAKKRYYQSVKDRMAESRGMERYEVKKRMRGEDSRRAREREYGEMISEDRNAVANLPQDVKMVAYPKVEYSYEPDLADNLSGVDAQMKSDVKRADWKMEKWPEKY